MNPRIDLLTLIAAESHARILSEARIWQALGRSKVWQDVQVGQHVESPITDRFRRASAVSGASSPLSPNRI